MRHVHSAKLRLDHLAWLPRDGDDVRRLAQPLQPFDHGNPADIGQHQVKNDAVSRGGRITAEKARGILVGENLVAEIAQQQGERVVHGRISFKDVNGHAEPARSQRDSNHALRSMRQRFARPRNA